ncbi:MAG TPA: glycosyltransferase 87 family protein [Solirubrobacterales bacterium]|nr:glycosyltransferase 87 family protein [Solirubrobacterales bacterium]
MKRWGPYLLIGALCAWLASRVAGTGDWDADAGPAIEALAAGDVGHYLSWASLVGPFASLVQAPFVALSGGSGTVAYQWAVFPCLFGAGLCGLSLGRIAARRGAPPLTQVLLPLLFLLNPITFEALETGHPEEILTAALAIAAIATAAEGHTRRTALLLGLAIASKQWAVIAILPALMVLPSQRIKVGLGAVAVAAALFAPSVVASPSSFLDVQRAASGTPGAATPWSAWYPLASEKTEVYSVGGEQLEAQVVDAPSLATSFSHSLIVLLALVLPLAVAWRRGLPLAPSDAFALLALIGLLRCALDPADNLYYHAPLLLAMFGWDAFSSRGLPLRSLLGVGIALLFWQAWHDISDPVAFNAVYLGFASVLGIALASSLFARIDWTGVPASAVFAGRNPNFRD